MINHQPLPEKTGLAVTNEGDLDLNSGGLFSLNKLQSIYTFKMFQI